MNIHLPRRICGDVHAALQREWLVTNGVGGFAAGTVAGAATRRYHGLLFAALRPPLGRTLLVAKLDEVVLFGGQEWPLFTNIWADGVESGSGCRFLQRFDLIAGVPTWRFELGGRRLVKRVWMEAGKNTTLVRYDLAADAAPLALRCRVLVNCRDYHVLRPAGDQQFTIAADASELHVQSSEVEVPLRIRCAAGDGAIDWQIDHTWCRDFHLPVEAARGFDHREDHLSAGLCRLRMQPGATVTFVIAAGEDSELEPASSLERCEGRALGLMKTWTGHTGLSIDATPIPVAQLVFAADQFVVRREMAEEKVGHTLIAGYPWFTDWGRDTMIALPGLTLVTGRHAIAREILLTWAEHVDDGLIPNRFPDGGEHAEYHTADATLWFLWAIDQYVRATGDVEALAGLFPVMAEIIQCHLRGTRHNIRVDDDGLVHAGEHGVNLTWMDAKIADRVVTPRMGKPIELSALWYDGLCNMARLADLVEKPGDEYVRLAARTRASCARFWNTHEGSCYDVLDGPDGNDARVRPNQILAVSLTHSPLPREQQEAVVRTCEQRLLTWFGLRSLAPDTEGYRGQYAGGPVERDESYHQGTAWGWLLGPFVTAHYRVHRDARRAREFLTPLLGQLWAQGVGSLSEICDGEPPHLPKGCPAQAWTVAEALRAWWFVHTRGAEDAR